MESNRPDPARIEDFGQKIGGAHKDRFDGISVSAVSPDKYDDYFAERGITKEAILGDVDYVEMVTEGRDALLCAVYKKIRDSLPARPRIERIKPEYVDLMIALYSESLGVFRDTFSMAMSANDFLGFEKKLIPQMLQEIDGREYLSERASRICDALGGNRGFCAIQIYEEKISKIAEEIKESGWPLTGTAAPTVIKIKRPICPNPTRTVGRDYRQGKATDESDIIKVLSFRAGEFGNWTNQAERRYFLNAFYDGMMDLAFLFGVSSSMTSFDGSLAVAFGSRGKGGAVAHFEPGKQVIHFTRMSWIGSVAHEWAHALDCHLGKVVYGHHGIYYSVHEEYMRSSENVNYSGPQLALSMHIQDLWEIVGYYRELCGPLESNSLYGRSFQMDQNRKHPYYSLRCEIFARIIEACVADALRPDNSDWLVYGCDNGAYTPHAPYPTKEEMELLRPWFRKFRASVSKVLQPRPQVSIAPVLPIAKTPSPTSPPKAISTEEQMRLW
jgi:hypothetical protein